MSKFFDIETGQELTPEQYGPALQAGRLGVDSTQPIVMRDGAGSRIQLKPGQDIGTQVGRYLEEGYEVETAEMTASAEASIDARESPALAVGEQVARSLTLGASDLAADALLGDEYTRNAALRKESLDRVAPIIDAGTTVAAALATGGTSAVARGLAATPAGLLAKGAAAAGASLEKALLARGVGAGAAKIAGMASEGTLDGALASVGAELSESTLGDTEITAERLLAAGGIGGLFGLAGGAGVGALGGIGRRGARAIADRRAAKLAGQLDDTATETVEHLGGKDAGLFEMVPEGLVNRVTKMSSDPEIMRDAINDKTFRSDILQKDAVKSQLNKEIRTDLQDALDAEHLVRKIYAGEPKSYNVYQDIPDNLGAGRRAMKEIDVIVGDYKKGLDDLNSGGMLSAPEYKRLSKEIDHTLGQVRKGFSIDGHNAEAFLALENFKRVADDRRKKTARNVTGDLAQRETLPAIHKMSSELGDQLRKHLENVDYYGEAGRKQAERNAAGHAAFNTASGFRRQIVQGTGESIDLENWDVERMVADGTKVDGFLSNLLNPNKEFDTNQVRRHLVSLENMYDTLRRNNDIPENFHEADFVKAHEGVKRAISKLDEADNRLGRIGRYEAVEAAGADISRIADPIAKVGAWGGAAVGLAVGGPAGGAVGGAIGGGLPKALGLATNPGGLIRTIGRIEALRARSTQVQETVQSKTTRAVRELAKPKSERRLGPALSKGVVRAAVRDRAAERERAQKVEKRLNEYSADPMRLVDALAYQSKSVADIAPATTAAYQQRALKAMEFLKSKIPKPPANPNKLQPTLNKLLWDTETTDKFGRYLDVLDDPSRAVDMLEKGKLTEAHVEVLREVYPSIYQDMRAAAMEEIARQGDAMPYDSVIQLSLLLDIDGHPTLSPQFQATLKDIRAKSKEEAKASAPPPSQQKPIKVQQSFVDRLAGGLQ